MQTMICMQGIEYYYHLRVSFTELSTLIPNSTPFDDEEIVRLRIDNWRRRSSHEFASPTTDLLRNEIVEARCNDLDDYVWGKTPQAMIIIGPPASGKSMEAEKLRSKVKVKIIDSDDIKEKLPEFSNGHHAAVVHLESSDLSHKVYEMAIDRRTNIILPLVGRDAKRILDLGISMHLGGYDVHLVCTDLDPMKAAENAVSRFRTGPPFRFVDPLYILEEVKELPAATFDAIEKATMVDDTGRPLLDKSGMPMIDIKGNPLPVFKSTYKRPRS